MADLVYWIYGRVAGTPGTEVARGRLLSGLRVRDIPSCDFPDQSPPAVLLVLSNVRCLRNRSPCGESGYRILRLTHFAPPSRTLCLSCLWADLFSLFHSLQPGYRKAAPGRPGNFAKVQRICGKSAAVAAAEPGRDIVFHIGAGAFQRRRSAIRL